MQSPIHLPCQSVQAARKQASKFMEQMFLYLPGLLTLIFPGYSCLTIEGASELQQYVSAVFDMAGQVGLPCKFPFSVKYSLFGWSFGPFDACTDLVGEILKNPETLISGKQLLCATSVDGNGNGIKFGVCDPNCLSGK